MPFNKKITINIGGGLGNQFFQYAVARRLSIKYNAKIVLDKTFFENIPAGDTPRKFQIDLYQVKPDLIISKTNNLISVIRFLSRLILRPFKDDAQINIFNILLKLNLPVYLTRNFQKEKYFSEIRDILLKEITLKKPLADESLEQQKIIDDCEQSVSIHVRRTDILNPKHLFGGICDIPYYHKAISLIKEKIDNPIFFIFSDDIDWCKENLKLSNKSYFVSNPNIKDYEELVFMSSCKHNIIANSTFSWWGAWLNKNNAKIVIAPKQWTRDRTSNEWEILPKSWIQI